MDQNNIMFICDFTGRGLNDYELHFYNLYEKTEYKNKFNEQICYDFNYENTNTCSLDLTKNYPIFKNNKIIKINYYNKIDFLELINKNIEYKNLIKKKFNKKLKDFIDMNMYVYRNIINNNLTDHVVTNLKNSIFNNLNNQDSNYLKEKIKETLHIEYNEIILVLYNNNINFKFNEIINLFDIKDPYFICNQFTKFINTLNEN